MGFVSLIQRSIKSRPILTNTAIYATFYTAAELSQQTYNKYYTDKSPEYDFVSAARIVTVGCSIYAPTLTICSSVMMVLATAPKYGILIKTKQSWYRILDRKFAGQAVKAVASKVCLDQFLMTPFLMAAFYSCLGFLENKDDPFGELKAKYVKTLVANQAFWLPAQTLNFSLIPSHLRVAYVASMSFVWINVLCFIKRQKKEQIV